jgi:hypothetical protein
MAVPPLRFVCLNTQEEEREDCGADAGSPALAMASSTRRVRRRKDPA